jgi:hypothetical protein
MLVSGRSQIVDECNTHDRCHEALWPMTITLTCQMSTLDCPGRGLGIGAASFCITLTLVHETHVRGPSSVL